MSSVASVRLLQLIRRNVTWWHAPISTSVKLFYYGSMLSSLSRAVAIKKFTINYLGNTLHYDNLVTPLSLQVYPYEITRNILSNAANIKIKKVLDVGGNIGQFCLTLSYVLQDNVLIDVLEPNPEIYSLLRKNTSRKKNIRTYNVGVGKPTIKHLFYVPGKSAAGSILKDNANHGKKRVRKTTIQVTDDIPGLTGLKDYDLIKIDVEGYEYTLLEEIKPIVTKLMVLEVSGLGRYKNFTHSRLFSLIESKFGKFDIVHLSHSDARSVNFDIMLRFV